MARCKEQIRPLDISLSPTQEETKPLDASLPPTKDERPPVRKEYLELDSYLEDKRLTYTWKIENFSYISCPTGIPIVSNNFGVEEIAKWNLELFPNGSEAANAANIELYLRVVFLQREIEVKIKLCCKGKYGCEYFTNSGKVTFSNVNDYHVCPSWAQRDALLCNEDILFRDVLTVYCELFVPQVPFHSEVRHIDEEAATYDLSQFINKTSLRKNFGKMYKDGLFCDFTLTTREKKFNVHRAVLAAHSSVFDEMFQNDEDLRVLEISDIAVRDPFGLGPGGASLIEASVISHESFLEEFLEFLYTGMMEDMETEKATNLLHLAQKYKVEALKRICVAFLCSNICNFSFYDVALFGATYNEPNLLATAKTFFAINCTKMILSCKWETFAKMRPDIVEEIQKSFLMKH